MSEKLLVSGNVAVAMGAIAAGCKYYFGYPITPQSEIPEYMSRELPKNGGVFLQAESEIASINMLLGASACGQRAMTSSSSPGISLKQEGISYMAGSELPGLIVNICRSGPGLGGIDASQADYFQSVKTGGHGGYRVIVVAPDSVQEMYDLAMLAFDLSDTYRTPALLLADSVIGQMKEALEPKTRPEIELPAKEWAVTGKQGRDDQRIVKSLYLGEGELEQHNWKLYNRYQELCGNEQRYEGQHLEDAELIITAYGSSARIAKSALRMAREAGLKVGLLRPITLYPFPEKGFKEATAHCKQVLCVELSTGQMVEDVRLSVCEGTQVDFYGRPPGTGSLPTPEELFEQIRKRIGGDA
ncbi:MAG: 3-methyl-2-oxobutanoate dehydrogenase subunit VorB [Desulfuromonas sp.]|nr:MAG: 3-methyl-2-oxobutanoate dehydrogenase subunit VorB [Desulfuromonas sp.]